MSVRWVSPGDCLFTLAADRFLASVAFGVEATDPPVLAAAAMVLLAIVLLAGSLPALESAAADPAAALQDE